MKVALAAEVVSFDLMGLIKENLKKNNHEVFDVGMQSREAPKYFYETPALVANLILDKTVDRGILMCGTGMGVCISANKIKGIYAGVAESPTTAHLNYVINRTNILCLGAWVVGIRAIEIINAYLSAEIGDGMGEERKLIQKRGFERIQEMEMVNFR